MTAPDHGAERHAVTVLEGLRLQQRAPQGFALTSELFSTHILFLGSIGSGKTNGMKHLLRRQRSQSGPDDVFIIFDTKGDFLRDFRRPGDAVITSDPDAGDGGVRWNLFSDLSGDPQQREEQSYEIATALFSEQLDRAGQNTFFAAAARDIFAGAVAAMAGAPNTNAELRAVLEGSPGDLLELLGDRPGLARYLESETAGSILAFLQLVLRQSLSGVFRERGDFSVRDFVRGRGGRALFIEYDITVGSSLLPVYRVLIDTAIREALGFGRMRLRERERVPDSFYFVLDEFALLPRLAHISDGVNFGRELGLKFLVATQNVSQVLGGYPGELGHGILSGFGTVLAFRLFDESSRGLLRQRYGMNRKKVTTTAAVRQDGVQETVVVGNVIEDWQMTGLGRGQCIAAPPDGAPFLLQFAKFEPG